MEEMRFEHLHQATTILVNFSMFFTVMNFCNRRFFWVQLHLKKKKDLFDIEKQFRNVSPAKFNVLPIFQLLGSHVKEKRR